MQTLDTPAPFDTAADARATKSMLIEHGWVRGHWNQNDEICLGEAMMHVTGVRGRRLGLADWSIAERRFRALAKVVLAATNAPSVSAPGPHTSDTMLNLIIAFNDQVCTGLNDVLDVLDQAEKIAEAAALDA